MHFSDPLFMPGTNESPEELLQRVVPLHNTEGEQYVKRRGIPIEIAHETGVRYCDKYIDRPAIIIPLRDQNNTITSIHGRYLTTIRKQNKMFTFGKNDGIISVLGGWQKDPLIIVEGLFDALSLALCGYPASATIGRSITWLPEFCKNRNVWLGFDACRPAEAEVTRYKSILIDSRVNRLLPPYRSKDWNTALAKHGKQIVITWINNIINNSNHE